MLIATLLLVYSAVAALKCQESEVEIKTRESGSVIIKNLNNVIKVPISKRSELARALDKASSPFASLLTFTPRCVERANGGVTEANLVLDTGDFIELQSNCCEDEQYLSVFAGLLRLMKSFILLDTAYYIDHARSAFVYNEVTGEMRLTGLGLTTDESQTSCPPERNSGHACTIYAYMRRVFESYKEPPQREFVDSLFEIQHDSKELVKALERKLEELKEIFTPVFYAEKKKILGDVAFYARKNQNPLIKFYEWRYRRLIVTLRLNDVNHEYEMNIESLRFRVFLCYMHAKCVDISDLEDFVGWLPQLQKDDAYALNFKLEKLDPHKGSHAALYVIVVVVQSASVNFAREMVAFSHVKVELFETPVFGACFDEKGKFKLQLDGLPGKPLPDPTGLEQVSAQGLKFDELPYLQLRPYAKFMANDTSSCLGFDKDFRIIKKESDYRDKEIVKNFLDVVYNSASNALYFSNKNYAYPDQKQKIKPIFKAPEEAIHIYTHREAFYLRRQSVESVESYSLKINNALIVRYDNKYLEPFMLPIMKNRDSVEYVFDFTKLPPCFLVKKAFDEPDKYPQFKDSEMLEVLPFEYTHLSVMTQDQLESDESRLIVAVTDKKIATVFICYLDGKRKKQCRLVAEGFDMTKKKQSMKIHTHSEWIDGPVDFLLRTRFIHYERTLLIKAWPLDNFSDCIFHVAERALDNVIYTDCIPKGKFTDKHKEIFGKWTNKSLSARDDFCNPKDKTKKTDKLRTMFCKAPQGAKKIIL